MATMPPKKRAAIIKAVKTGGKTARQIAKEHDVAHSTVSRVASQEGITDAFDRSQTEKATAAKAVDCRARREQLKADLLEDAQRLRTRAWSPYEALIDNRSTGTQQVTLDLPPLPDQRAAYSAISICIDKSVKLEQYDTADSSGNDAKGMLGALAEGIRLYAQASPPFDEASDD